MSKWFGQVLKFGILAGAGIALVVLTQGMEPFGRALLVIGLPLWYFISLSIDGLTKKIGLDRLPPYQNPDDRPEAIVPKHEVVRLPHPASPGGDTFFRRFFAQFAPFPTVFNEVESRKKACGAFRTDR